MRALRISLNIMTSNSVPTGASSGNPFMLPPIMASDAGVDPACASKGCFDFFDCLFVGCATACTNLKCM